MSVELTLLLWSLVVYALYLGAQSLIYRWRMGLIFAQTARDEAPRPEGELLGRAERALRNFNETYVPFVVLLLIAHLARQNDPLVFWGALIWFAARIAYLPLYLFGIFLVRSLVWCVSAIGLCLMFIGVLF
jgi:uncharacterized MAPEG superfamily protein